MKTLKSLKESDFQLSVDVSQLTEGEHKLNINVDGPENVNWTTDIETASIVLTEKEAS